MCSAFFLKMAGHFYSRSLTLSIFVLEKFAISFFGRGGRQLIFNPTARVPRSCNLKQKYLTLQ